MSSLVPIVFVQQKKEAYTGLEQLEGVQMVIELSFFLRSKKCWVKYNPVLGKYWTEHMLGSFQPTVG